jgi:hypothetical protein
VTVAVTWLKAKYLRGKTVGYKSKHNDGSRRKLKRKVSDVMKVRIRETQPDMLKVYSVTGKSKMVRR